MRIREDLQLVGLLAPPLGRAAAVAAMCAVRDRTRRVDLTGAVETDFDASDPRTLADPYPAYAALHAAGRVHYNPARRLWILTRLDDVREGAKRNDVLISGEGVTRVRMALPLLVTMDGERHAAMRRAVAPAFTKAAVESWRPMIDELAVEVVGKVLAEPGCDIVQRLAVPMPMLMIANMLGVPEHDLDDFREWSEACVRGAGAELTWHGAANLTAMVHGIRELYHYLYERLNGGELTGDGTLIGRLVAHESAGKLTSKELFCVTFFLLLAGNETTTNLLGAMFQLLAQHPEAFEAIRADPALMPAAIEEMLRHTSPVQALYRTAKTDYRVADALIPAGSRVLLSTGAANRDPSVFDRPDEFRLDRGTNPHIAFGFGAHMCMGATLTRMEGLAVLRELVQRADRVELVGTPRWSLNPNLRGPVEVRARVLPRLNPSVGPAPAGPGPGECPAHTA